MRCWRSSTRIGINVAITTTRVGSQHKVIICDDASDEHRGIRAQPPHEDQHVCPGSQQCRLASSGQPLSLRAPVEVGDCCGTGECVAERPKRVDPDAGGIAPRSVETGVDDVCDEHHEDRRYDPGSASRHGAARGAQRNRNEGSKQQEVTYGIGQGGDNGQPADAAIDDRSHQELPAQRCSCNREEHHVEREERLGYAPGAAFTRQSHESGERQGI
jgi:hypothetical protein